MQGIFHASKSLGMCGDMHVWLQAWYAWSCTILMRMSSILHFPFFVYWKDSLKISWTAKDLLFSLQLIANQPFSSLSYFKFFDNHISKTEYTFNSCSQMTRFFSVFHCIFLFGQILLFIQVFYSTFSFYFTYSSGYIFWYWQKS